MKYAIISAVVASSFALAASAMPASIDTDGDGMASLTELRVSYPELSEEVFNEIDTSGDGLVNDDEMAVAVENEILADPETDS